MHLVHFSLLMKDHQRYRRASEWADLLVDERNRIAVEIGLKPESEHSIEVELESAQFDQFMDLMSNPTFATHARVEGISVSEREPTHAERAWYRVVHRWEDYQLGERVENITQVKADRVPGRKHLYWAPFATAVSERFKQVVEASELTGLEFLWIHDVGKWNAPQWYQAIAREYIGRGVDHPWLDVARWKTHAGEGELKFRRGQRSFAIPDLKQGTLTDDPKWLRLLEAMRRSADSCRLSFAGRLMRRSLPLSDFAFDLDHMNYMGQELYMNERAQRVLAEAGLITPWEYEPVRVLDHLPAGCEDLESLGAPPHAWTPQAMDAERKKTAVLREEFERHPKPMRNPNFKQAMKNLAAFLGGERLPSAASALDLNAIADARLKLLVPIPDCWIKVWQSTRGLDLNRLDLYEPDQVIRQNSQDLSWMLDDPILSPKLLVIGSDTGGDSFALIVEDGAAADCRVIRINHDTNGVEREWRTIAAFLDDRVEEVKAGREEE